MSTYPTVVLVQMARYNPSNNPIKDLPCRRHSTLDGSWYSKNKYFSEPVARRCSVKRGVLKNFANFTGKHLYQSLFFNKVAGLTNAILFKNRLWHRCFPVNLAKFLRIPFLHNTSGQLLLFFYLRFIETPVKCFQPVNYF